MNINSVDVDNTSTKEEGEISDDDVSLDEVICFSYTDNNAKGTNVGVVTTGSGFSKNPNEKVTKGEARKNLNESGREKQNRTNVLPPIVMPPPVSMQAVPEEDRQNKKQKRKRTRPNKNFSKYKPNAVPIIRRATKNKKNYRGGGQPKPTRFPVPTNYGRNVRFDSLRNFSEISENQSSHPYNNIPFNYQSPLQHQPTRRFGSSFLRGKYSTNLLTKPDENFEDLLKKHKSIQEQLAKLECDSEGAISPYKSDDVEIVRVEHLTHSNDSTKENQASRFGGMGLEKVQEEEEDLAELRRLALMSAKNKQSQDDVKNTTETKTTDGENDVDLKPSGSSVNRERQNSAPVNRSDALLKKKTSRAHTQGRSLFNERLRRGIDEIEVNYSARRRRDSGHHSEERYRLEKERDAERRRRLEAEEQRREIQKILSLDNQAEQVERFLRYLEGHRRDKSKFDTLSELTTGKSVFKDPLPKGSDYSKPLRKGDRSVPLQDNYEEVEMDIDSNPASPIAGVEELNNVDYRNAMLPVPQMAQAIESYTTSDQSFPWLSEQIPYSPLLPYSQTLSTAVVPVTIPVEPPPPPPPLPDELPVPEEPRPPLPALDDEDEETAILREQLLKSLMEKRNSKEKSHVPEEPILKPELPATSTKEMSPASSRSASPAVTVSIVSNQTESVIPPVRKVVTSVTNLPKHKPVVIRLDASSSDEDEGEEPPASKTTFSLLGLDDFLKEARKSVEVSSDKPKTVQGRMKDVKEKEKELSKERELITKEQALLRMLINRAKNYQGSLKTASQKVDMLREQLIAAEKIAKANKVQLEKTKAQARKVKESLLKRKDKLKVSEESVVTLGREVYGSNYKPRLVMVEPRTSKRKGGNMSITVSNDLVSKNSETTSSSCKENAPPPPKIGKKISADKVREEKKRLQLLEKEFAEKIRLLKEAQAVKAIQRGSTVIPEPSLNEPLKIAQPQPQLDEIKLGGSDSDSVLEMCLPKPRRRSLAKLNSSNKPNVATPSKPCQFITKNISTNQHLSLKLPTGTKLSNLCKLQNEKVEKVLKSKKCVSWCKWRYSRQYSYISAPVKQIPSLQFGQKAKEKKTSSDIPTSNSSVTYSSPLLHFKSYRFSPFFRTKENKSIQSSLVANMINPHQILCRFDLQGKCNDDKCAGQHISDIMLSERGVMEDIVSYYPPLAGIDSKTPLSDYPVCISKYVESVVNIHQSKMTSDEICLLLLAKVTEAAGKSLPFTMFYKARKWHPCNIETPFHIPTTFKPDIQQSTNAVSKHRRELDDIVREEDVRYFVVEDNDVLDMESGVLEDPSNIALWLKLAYKKLNDTDRSSESSLDKALNVLARGIESNKNDRNLWYHYLLLYRRHPDSHDLLDICQTAVELSPSYDIWWLYLESIRSYSSKSSLCEKIQDFLLDTDTLNHEQRSHYLLEIVLFKVSLAVQSGRYKTGLNLLKSVIERKKNEESRIFQLLTICDKSIMWISFLHLLELHHLPASLYSSNNQNPARILSKYRITVHWKNKDMLTPVDDVIEYFWQAIDACSGGLDQADNNNLLHCQNLLENFVSYLTVQERWKDACEICRKVLQSCPSSIDMWLTAANLYASCGEENLSSAISVFDEAIKENQHSAKIFYHLANFQLHCEGADKALEILETFVISLFQVDKNQTPDPNVLYCSLLGQTIPFSTGLILMLKPDFSTQNSDKEILYVWLNYCFLLELQGDTEGTREMFETALTSIVKAEDLFVVWQSYLDFQCRQVDMNSSEPREIKLLQQLMNRSVVTMPTRFPIPWSEEETWVNYNLVNGLIDRCLCHLDSDDHLQALETYRDMMPDNMDLLMRACEEAIVRQEFQRASSLSISAIYDQVANIDFWKMIISAKQKEGRNREVTKLYQKSIEALPYCATLWKDFLLFEVTQGNEAMVKWLLKKNEEIGLSVQGFVATISS